MAQRATSIARTAAGFIIAPGAPALGWFLLTSGVPDYGGVLLFFTLTMISYAVTIALGIPAYILLRERHAKTVLPYLGYGALIAAVPTLIFIVWVFVSELPAPPEFMMTSFVSSLGILLIAVAYGMTSSLIFWVIAIWRSGEAGISAT